MKRETVIDVASRLTPQDKAAIELARENGRMKSDLELLREESRRFDRMAALRKCGQVGEAENELRWVKMTGLALLAVRQTGYTVEALRRGPRLHSDILPIIRKFCRSAADAGFTNAEISKFLGKTHGTICYHLKSSERC